MTEADTGPGRAGAYIKELRLQVGIRTRELADRSGYPEGSESVISQIENGTNGRENPTRKTLDRIVAGLGLSKTAEHQEVLRRGGRLKKGERVDTDTNDVESAIRRDPALLPAQREELLAHYRTIMRANRAQVSQ